MSTLEVSSPQEIGGEVELEGTLGKAPGTSKHGGYTAIPTDQSRRIRNSRSSLQRSELEASLGSIRTHLKAKQKQTKPPDK